MLGLLQKRFIKWQWILLVFNLIYHSVCQGDGSIICSELFNSVNLNSGFSRIEKDLSLVRPASSEAQRTLELIQFIHDFSTKSPQEILPSQTLKLLNKNLKILKKKIANLDDYNKISDPDGGLPAVILADKNLALFLLDQITKNTANKSVARQILHSILSIGEIHFPDDYTSTIFYTVIRQSYNQASGKMRHLIFDVSEPVIFYDGVFAVDLKNTGGENADQNQTQITFLNRLVARKALSIDIARSIFEKEILNINPLPLNKHERIALIKSLKIEDRQVNVNSILELAGFKLVETEFLDASTDENHYPLYRTKFISKFENDPTVSMIFIDDSILPPEDVSNSKPTTYSLKGIDQVVAFLLNPKPNLSLQIRATTFHGMPN